MDILIVKPYFATLILRGEKTWEIRGRNTNKRMQEDIEHWAGGME